jgi:Tfp pilus assembly protein PilV
MIIKNKKNKGFMMVEVLIAVSIIVVSVLVAMSVTQKSIFVSRQSVHTTQASFLLEEGSEAVRTIRDNTWDNISGLTTNTDYYLVFSSNTWTLSSSFNTIGIFTRTIRITDVSRSVSTGDIVSSDGVEDLGTKLITITVSWNEGGITLNKTLSFYIMDIFS